MLIFITSCAPDELHIHIINKDDSPPVLTSTYNEETTVKQEESLMISEITSEAVTESVNAFVTASPTEATLRVTTTTPVEITITPVETAQITSTILDTDAPPSEITTEAATTTMASITIAAESEAPTSTIPETTTIVAETTLNQTSLVIENNDIKVYVTNTGKKYHNDGCNSLSKSKIEMTLFKAVDEGYTPCSRCDPPEL
jgi:hypothetical protein